MTEYQSARALRTDMDRGDMDRNGMYSNDMDHRSEVDRRNRMINQRSMTANDVMNTLNEAVRANPLPAALIGMGILWMFTGGSRVALSSGGGRTSLFDVASSGAGTVGRTARRTTRAVGDTVSSAASAVSGAVSSTMSGAADAISGAAQTTSEMMDSGAEWVGDSMGDAREAVATPLGNLQMGLRDLFERHPITLGAAGIAVGAAIAASLPITSKEREMMGEASDAVRSKVSDLTHQAKDIANAAVDEADRQGLTVGNLKQAGDDLARKTGL